LIDDDARHVDGPVDVETDAHARRTNVNERAAGNAEARTPERGRWTESINPTIPSAQSA
jgi:hypothetical protein